MSNRVLLIGHNKYDLVECKKFKMNRGFHQPAPTTLLYDDWSGFDGDIITCHSQSFGAKYVCSIDFSPRFQYTRGIPVFGMPKRGTIELTAGMKEFVNRPDIIKFPYGTYYGTMDKRQNAFSSGAFALWFCMDRYDEVYTAGLDFIELRMRPKYDLSRAKKYIRGGAEDGITLRGYRGYESWDKDISKWFYDLRLMFPNVKVYKSHKISLLPCEVKNPLS